MCNFSPREQKRKNYLKKEWLENPKYGKGQKYLSIDLRTSANTSQNNHERNHT